MTEDKMIDKIVKLLAKAEKAGTPEEAEAFSAKAQELMTKWTIDELSVAAAQGRASEVQDTITKEYVKVSGTYPKAEAFLYQEVARANDCRVAFDSYGKRVLIVGYSRDLTNVKLLTASLLIQCQRLCNQAVKNEPDWRVQRPMDKHVYRRSFKEQFASTVGRRLASARKEVIAEADGSLLPMLASKASLVDDFVADLGWGAGRASRSRHSVRGSNAGRDAGSRADVGSPRVGQGVRGALGR